MSNVSIHLSVKQQTCQSHLSWYAKREMGTGPKHNTNLFMIRLEGGDPVRLLCYFVNNRIVPFRLQGGKQQKVHVAEIHRVE